MTNKQRLVTDPVYLEQVAADLARARTIVDGLTAVMAAQGMPADADIDAARTPILGIPVQSARVLCRVVGYFEASGIAKGLTS